MPTKKFPLPASKAPLWLLLLIAFTGTLAMHIFVPALPLVQRTLLISSQQAQMTITVYVIALALGQLVYGPISDAIGRRPAVFAGLLIYFGGALAAMLAPSLGALMTARFIQGLGGAGGLALARAMVRDGSSDVEATRQLALLNLIMLIGPGLAPIVGSLMATMLGWRSIFALLATMAALTILMALKKLPETHRPSGHFAPRAMLRGFITVLKNRRFALITIGGCLASTCGYAYIASAPYILHDQLGLPLHQVGFYVGFTLVGAAIGTLAARMLAPRLALSRFLLIAGVVAVLFASLFMGLVLTHSLTPGWVLALTFLIIGSAGAISPLALSEALAVLPQMTGSASGAFGFCQMMTGALCTFVVGLGRNPALACASVLLGAFVLSTVLLWYAERTPVTSV